MNIEAGLTPMPGRANDCGRKVYYAFAYVYFASTNESGKGGGEGGGERGERGGAARVRRR